MNKLLPILLVVVLSACGGAPKTPLENCADNSMNDDIKMDGYMDRAILESSKEDFMNKYANSKILDVVGYDMLLRIAKEKEAYIGFLDLSIQDKLQDRDYEKYFKKCERKRRSYPETFDAKWK